MEPDVIRMYSSSPPPMEDGGEEEDDEFSNFTGVPNSISFSEFDTPTVFDQLQALNATSPPELIGNGRIMGLHGPAKCNGGIPLDSQVSDACRTVNADELKKEYANCTDVSENARTDRDDVDRNGSVGGVEALTNGFSPFGAEESPPSCHKRRGTEDSSPDAVSNNDDDDDFADFSAFSNTDVPSRFDQESGQHGQRDDHKERPSEDGAKPLESEGERVASTATEENAGVTGFTSLALSLEEPSESLSNGQWALHSEQRDLTTENAHLNSNTADRICTGRAVAQNGEAQNSLEVKEKEEEHRASPISEDDRGGGSSSSSSEPTGNDTETETETETSFGRPLSTDALEEFGDFSTTGSVPSPPLQEETATPADHSQLAEEDDEDDFGDFGDFGDANSFGGAGFAEFDQQGAAARVEQAESAPRPEPGSAGEEKFGDFGVPTDADRDGQTDEGEAEFANFPGSDSFADFTSAPVTVAAAAAAAAAAADAADDDGGGGWQAFNEPESSPQPEESWAAFGPDQGSAFSESSNKDWHEGHSDVEPPTEGSREDGGKDVLTASLISRLEKLFLVTFPEAEVSSLVLEVPPLIAFLQPDDRTERQENGAASDGTLQGVWRQLQDVHNAFGLRHQWGGSHSNKTLLSSLGIDTRNILFTGQKKQPVIVPMYAASLGMLEPTKEPVKPVSAAEMIASIAQSPSVAAEMSSCPSDTVQESLPPVQFDWSSSGLTNPLDASGGSSLLNLDFFGPVDESPSSAATSIPGVDPELYELTQVKLEVSGGSNVVADAFARLMSTVEKTNTSTRKVQKEENLSDEARQVISTLPDLSFMQAKVLMFPSTLTPLPRSSSAASPVPD